MYESFIIVDKRRKKNVKFLNNGSEGSIYALNSKYVVKVYHEPNPVKLEKISALISKIKLLSLRERRYLKKHLAYPIRIVTDEQGNEIGFVMHRFKKDYTMCLDMFHYYKTSYRRRFVFGAQFAKVLSILHKNRMYVGDFNPKNFLADKKGKFVMVDVDTLDFHYNKKHYRGMAMFPETLSNKTYSFFQENFDEYLRNPKLVAFDEESDDFSFAYTLFKILACGSPYACVPSFLDERTRRMLGICPIYKNSPEYSIPPYIVKKKHFGHRLNKYFSAVFTKNAHIKSISFYRALKHSKRKLRYLFFHIKTYEGKIV